MTLEMGLYSSYLAIMLYLYTVYCRQLALYRSIRAGSKPKPRLIHHRLELCA